MSRSNGKYAQFISDRSGMAFPYKEMVVEWNGSRVHVSEFEPKQPQLEPKPTVADPQGLQYARPARTEPPVLILLQTSPFETIKYAGNTYINVFSPNHDRSTGDTEPNHQRSTDDIVVFRNVDGSPGGLNFSLFENASGFSITVINTNSYSFNCGSNATLTGDSGGMTATAGPVTLTP